MTLADCALVDLMAPTKGYVHLRAICCPCCGGVVSPVTQDSGRFPNERATVLECPSCRWQGVYREELVTTRAPGGRPRSACGTDSGYQSHRLRNETPCDACAEAHREANRRLRVTAVSA